IASTFLTALVLRTPVSAQCPGPDIIVANLTDIEYDGSFGVISAYSVGTDACNPGCAPASWDAGTNMHPVIAQDMYRLRTGRFEQIGMSWLKHGFSSTNHTTCGPCTQPPGGNSQLGIGCSDAYFAALNATQDMLGPRSQVNATTGFFP